MWPKVAALIENSFELDDSPRARAVVGERKKQEERERRQHEEHEKEMAAIREAMHPPVGFYVKGSVGEDGRNDPADVHKTARRLRELGFLGKETTDPDEVAKRSTYTSRRCCAGASRTAASTRAARPSGRCARAGGSRWRCASATGCGSVR